MDKSDFIRIAPTYYHAAIATALEGTWGHFTKNTLRAFYRDGGDVFLEHEELIKLALNKLISEGAVSELPDPFGEPLYQKTDLFDDVIQMIKADTGGPYFKNKIANDRNEWMRGALYRVNEQYISLSIRSEDLATELPDEWAPIQINPDEPAIQEAVRQLQEAATAVEQDNGYSATYPQERDQVVQDLKGGLEKLQASAVSVGWLRRTVNALKTASLRFANTTKGEMIDGALTAVKDVIKHHIGSALEGLWSYFF